MNEYYCNTSAGAVLLCKDSDEALIFDSFGVCKDKTDFKSGLTHANIGVGLNEVVFCSIGGKAPNVSVYVGGKVCLVSGTPSSIFIKLKQGLASRLVSAIPYKVKSIDDVPVTILVLKAGTAYSDVVDETGIGLGSNWLDV